MLKPHPVYIPDTRPVMIPGLGVPYELVVIIAAAFFIAVDATGKLTDGMPSLILLLIGWFVSKDDPHAIRGLFVAFRTSGFMFDRWLWGGASLSAMPASFRLRHARSI